MISWKRRRKVLAVSCEVDRRSFDSWLDMNMFFSRKYEKKIELVRIDLFQDQSEIAQLLHRQFFKGGVNLQLLSIYMQLCIMQEYVLLTVMVNKVIVAVHDESILGSGARREDTRRWFSTPTDSTG